MGTSESAISVGIVTTIEVCIGVVGCTCEDSVIGVQIDLSIVVIVGTCAGVGVRR